MKKKVIIGIISVLVVISGCLFVMFNSSNKSYYVITNNNEEKIMNTNALTMMYETEAGSGEYQVTSDTTWLQDGYIFNERLSGCENGSTLTWDDERKAVILSTNVSDKCYVYFDKEPEIVYFADYIIDNVYVEDGVNGLYYHDGAGTYGSLEAGDNSYRYSGANPNNYVCFGSTAATCPNDNLYRIIGVFGNQVKLIKSTSYGDYVWVSGNSNVWSSSDINNTLNRTYLNSLGSTWSSKIATHTWYVGGHTTYNATAKEFYNAESSGTTWNGKVGLMYVSDYGYAANSNAWSDDLYNYKDYSSTNWLFFGQ